MRSVSWSGNTLVGLGPSSSLVHAQPSVFGRRWDSMPRLRDGWRVGRRREVWGRIARMRGGVGLGRRWGRWAGLAMSIAVETWRERSRCSEWRR